MDGNRTVRPDGCHAAHNVICGSKKRGVEAPHRRVDRHCPQ